MLRQAGFMAAALLLGACNTMGLMEIPPVSDDAATNTPPIDMDWRNQPPIAFERAVSSIRRGTVIAHFPAQSIKGVSTSFCNSQKHTYAPVEWGEGKILMGTWSDDTGAIVFETFKNAGYNIVGDPNQMFGANEDRLSARYLIAAQITEVRGNICDEYSIWTGYSTDRIAGELYQKVKWSIYSPYLKKVIGEFETEGYSLNPTPKQQGLEVLFLDSFAEATDKLAQNKDFAALILGEATSETTESAAFSTLIIPHIPLSRSAFNSHSKEVLDGVVTVSLGQAHGSGFIISDDGLILTNQHVVQSADEVLIRLSNGLEVTGEVLRRNSARDIALIKVPLRGLPALPLNNTGRVKILDPVIAVGSPMDESLQGTVTQGVISNPARIDQQTGLTFIQSDTSVNPGNSGGPLLDEHGNVVAISVSGLSRSGGNTGLNFFIPIASALEELNIVQSAPSS